MRLQGELSQVLKPRRIRIAWGIFYVGLAIISLGGLYFVADHVKTHTLPTGKLLLSTPYSKYVLGETITFSITNDYNAPIYFTNQCPTEPLAVYRQTGGKWLRLHFEAAAKDCPEEDRQVSIPPSSTVTSSFAPWRQLFDQAGKYRLVAIVNNYNSLPYVDLEVVAPLPPPVAQSTSTAGVKSTKVALNNLVQPQIQTHNQAPSTTPTSSGVKPTAKTIVLHVNSSGNYDLLNLTLNAGDSIQIVYSPPINNEVRTHFTPKAPTTSPLSSITVDSEFTSRTQQINSKGTWTFKADDHSGNSGSLIVN